MLKKNGILASRIEDEAIFARKRIIDALAGCFFEQIIELNEELEGLELDELYGYELMVTFGKTLLLMTDLEQARFYEEEEDESG